MSVTCRPVRAILFDKSSANNWHLGWHQDRTICVAERREVDGFGNWTSRQGLHHVEPPQALLDRMVTSRIHLDAVDRSNAPLIVAPGSHRMGRIRVDEVQEAVARCGSHVCQAAAGDIWAYSTPILHMSEAARGTHRRRRVFQIDYAAEGLPGGLAWLGV
jgi:hypothetical protein